MKINDALRITRYESGKSQEYMALELGVTRRTIMNWENAVSEPSVTEAIAWFRLLNKNPIPFLLQIINDLPAEGVRQLMYLFFGNHGSSPRAVLQMITAHLQTPMKDRIAHCQLTATNYELAQKTNTLTQPNHIQPDLEYLSAAIDAAKTAVEKKANEYSIVD